MKVHWATNSHSHSFNLAETFVRVGAYVLAGVIVLTGILVFQGCVKRTPLPSDNPDRTVVDKKEFARLSGVVIDSTVKTTPATVMRADILYPGDVLGVTLYDKMPVSQDKREEVKRINEEGYIFVLPIGDVKVGGLTLSQAEQLIEDKLASYVVTPHCEIVVSKRAYEPRIYVFGEVGRTGTQLLKPGNRLLDAVSDAGGCNANAYRRSIKIIRIEGQQVAMLSINLSDILNNGRLDQNIMMQDQDVIFVPRRFLTNLQEVATLVATVLPWYYFMKNF